LKTGDNFFTARTPPSRAASPGFAQRFAAAASRRPGGENSSEILTNADEDAAKFPAAF
jgi:hypothetical protein